MTTVSAAFAFLLVPLAISTSRISSVAAVLFGALGFIALYLLRDSFFERVDKRIRSARLSRTETRILLDFAERVGMAFSILDLVDAIREKLEKTADVGAILVRSNTWEIIYQSPTAAANDPVILETLQRNFREWSEGFCFINSDLSLANSNVGARGFFVYSKGFHLFFLTRLCPLIDLEAFRTLYGELRIYFDRVITISDLFEVASLSKEWELIAETQRSFLPKKLPVVGKLDLAVSYSPLVNVSGDYYDAIAIDASRTLLVCGDVSGKGLAAALIMGIIVNTIRVAQDKADLSGLVRIIDQAIRSMGFDDKYTVLFLGLVDTEKRTFRYVNAAMADPILITQTALGPRLERLEPTMGLVGLVPLEDKIPVEELSLRTDMMILLASDGVTEVTDAEGTILGGTERFEKHLLAGSKLGAAEYVGGITGLLYEFVGDASLKDDVTILAAKVGKLWD